MMTIVLSVAQAQLDYPAHETSMTLSLDGDAFLRHARSDAELKLCLRYWTGVIRLDIGEASWDARVDDGDLVSFAPADAQGEWDIRVSGPEGDWRALLATVPGPLKTDVYVATFSGMRLEGDAIDAVGPYYPAVQRLIALLREFTSGARHDGSDPEPFAATDDPVGRYVRVSVGGVQYRVYYEEAGEGVPLLLQHTAGADSRQWRHVLASSEMQRRFRMVAYDLPYHGYSVPPTGDPWWEQEYRATKDELMERVVAISRALELDRPVFMGCGIGGHLAADLAAHHPVDFRAFVSLNGWYHLDELRDVDSDGFFHPRVLEQSFAVMQYGATSPLGPEALRREVQWVYASGGPGVYKGDLEYFLHDHDLREDGHLIDTSRTPLYALAGEYDRSAASKDAGAAAIARNVTGAHHRVLPGLGPFMMSEAPEAFVEQITPVMDEILATTNSSAS